MVSRLLKKMETMSLLKLNKLSNTRNKVIYITLPETEGVFFHERKALSHFEKRYTKRSQLRDFNVDVLRYEDSLQQAITDLETKLKAQQTKHAEMSLASLARLKEDYSLQYKENFK